VGVIAFNGMPNREYCLELAQSHDGSLGYVFSMLTALHKRSIKIAKFQLHWPEYESTSDEHFRIALSGQDKTRYKYWERTGFSQGNWKLIKEKCDSLDIEFLCTPLSPEAVDFLETLDVKRYKVASGDLTNAQLVQYIADTGKEIILSTGMSSFDEIAKTVGMIDHKRLILLQCTSSYPTSIQKIGLNVMTELKRMFPKIRIGFSDHTGNPMTAILAFAQGAEFVEQHIVFSREQYGPDSTSSIELKEMELVQEFLSFSNLASSFPVDKDSVVKEMNDVRYLFGRGLAPRRDLLIGEIVSESDLTMKKPLGPFAWSDRLKLIGKKLRRDVPASSHLCLEDFELE